jgi:hypothetical protein
MSPCFDRESYSRGIHRKVALTLLLLLAANAIGAPKVEIVGACTDSTVPASVKKALAPTGYRVTLDDGAPLDVWPPAQVQTSDKPREDATYPLALSVFLGVIHFARNARDARGNAISAGTYTLRYGLQPNDGNHLGTSATPDFLLLVPVAADTNPAQTYSFDQLVLLSQQVTGKRHPAPFNLVPADATQFPSATTDPEDHTILFFKVKTQSGDLPLGLVVKGTTAE